MEIYCVKEVEQNPLPKSQTKLFISGLRKHPVIMTDIVMVLSPVFVVVPVFVVYTFFS